jgi:hypothetical protein
MNVYYLSTTVPETQTAAILMDLSCVATLGILEMEKFVKVNRSLNFLIQCCIRQAYYFVEKLNVIVYKKINPFTLS